MDVWAIKDWDLVFESYRTREVKGPLDFLLVPTQRQSEVYLRLMQSRDGLIAYAVFVGLLRIAARGRPRGVLASDRGPMQTSTIAARISVSHQIVAKAIALLASPEVGWLVRLNGVPSVDLHGQRTDAAPTKPRRHTDGRIDSGGGLELERIGTERNSPPSPLASEGEPVGSSRKLSRAERNAAQQEAARKAAAAETARLDREMAARSIVPEGVHHG